MSLTLGTVSQKEKRTQRNLSKMKLPILNELLRFLCEPLRLCVRVFGGRLEACATSVSKDSNGSRRITLRNEAGYCGSWAAEFDPESTSEKLSSKTSCATRSENRE
jgi:hypothetical protein